MNYIFPLSQYLTITQGFHSKHLGMDFGWTSNYEGQSYSHQAIIAAEEGTVVERADGWGNTYPSKRIYGNYVMLKHDDGNYTVYGHLQKGVLVKKGDRVKKGQVLGYMGASGYAIDNGQHLHFEIRVGGKDKKKYARDPLNYLAIENPKLIISPRTSFPDRIKFRKTTWGEPVPRNNEVNQINVKATTLRARLTPSLKGEVLGYTTPGIYNLSAEADADGYHWFNAEDFWCANNDDKTWVEYLPKAVKKYNLTVKGLTEAQLNALVAYMKQSGFNYVIEEI